MTLIIIFAILAALGIPFLIWQRYIKDCWSIWRGATGACLTIFFGICLIVSILDYVPSKKNSEIQYKQFMQEKAAIEQMISTNKDVDKLMLNQKVIEYNNRVIETKENSKRFIYRDYYSKNVDWNSLELIEWR